jgi:radical SAM protein with 4Fe4S-binding SPASM domain
MNTKLNDKVIFRAINKIVFSYNVVEGSTLLFNDSGSYIISRLIEGSNYEEIGRDYSRHFGTTHIRTAEIMKNFFKDLDNNKILEVEISKSISEGLQKREIVTNQSFLKYTIEKRIPLQGHFELTYNCNFRCLHCYNTKGMNGCELSIDEIDRILKELQKAGTLFLTFSGGELFTRNDWYDILSKAKELDFVINILTNGSLIEDEIIGNLKLLGLNSIQISLNAFQNKAFYNITGSDSFEKVKDNILLLKANEIDVSIGITAMVINYDAIDDILSFGESNNIPVILGYFLVPKNDGDDSPIAYRLHSNKLRRVIEKTNIIESLDSLKATRTMLGENVCTAGLNQFMITPYGEVYPCVQIPQSCGSLRFSSFQNIWDNSEVLAHIRKVKINDLETCKNCNLYDCCDRCGGLALLENKSYYDISPYNCEIAKIMKGWNEHESGEKCRLQGSG